VAKFSTIHVFNPTTKKINSLDLDSPSTSRIFIEASTFAKRFKLDIEIVEHRVCELSFVPDTVRESYFEKLGLHQAAEFLSFTDGESLINREAVLSLLDYFAVHMNKRAQVQLERLMLDFVVVDEVTAEWDKEAA
jgi:hypothetical protein